MFSEIGNRTTMIPKNHQPQSIPIDRCWNKWVWSSVFVFCCSVTFLRKIHLFYHFNGWILSARLDGSWEIHDKYPSQSRRLCLRILCCIHKFYHFGDFFGSLFTQTRENARNWWFFMDFALQNCLKMFIERFHLAQRDVGIQYLTRNMKMEFTTRCRIL